jgi:predicted NBD/HSP70 family sugar kinase
MARSNISSIVDECIRMGLVTEKRGKPEGRGRVPLYLRLSESYSVLAASIRPSETHLAISGLSGEVRATTSFDTPDSPEEFVERIVAAVGELIRPWAGRRSFDEMGVSVPGLVTDQGTVLWIPTLPKFAGFDLGEALSRKLSCPVRVDNDCNLGALAELWLSQKEGPGLDNFVFLEVGDLGVGAGIVLHGELYRGYDGRFAAEFGHMAVDPAGPACRCGRQGCWELLVCDAATWARYSAGTRFNTTRFERLCREAVEGEPDAVAALESTGQSLSLGISNIVFALNPEVVVLAGRITSAWSVVGPVIEKACAARDISLNVRPARRSPDELFLHGAASLALSRVFARPGVASAIV